MSMALQYYALNKGLDSIDYTSSAQVSTLPEGMPTLLPPGSQVSAQLAQVLHAPALGEFLESAFSPAISNQALLSPQGFRSALRGSANELAANLKATSGAHNTVSGSKNGASANGTDAADSSKTIRDALSIVRRAMDMHAELAGYQGLLIAG